MLPFFIFSYDNIRMTLDLFSPSNHSSDDCVLIELEGAQLRYFPNFLSSIEADASFSLLRSEICWQQEFIRMYGRDLPIPRLSAWYGDTGVSYSYSGIEGGENVWTSELRRLRREVEQRTGYCFNGVLANLYCSGQDSVSWHSDDERSLGPDPVVASLSLGETRRFQLKHKSGKGEMRSMDLAHGSLLLMLEGTQKNWMHQVPKSRREIGERINLTFRRVF